MDSSALSSGGTISQNEGIHSLHAVMLRTAMFHIDSIQFNVLFYFYLRFNRHFKYCSNYRQKY